MRLTGGQITAGELAVAGFFILSGFLIAKSWLRSAGPANYLWKRVMRIYPGFLAAVAFCGFVVGPLAVADVGAYWREFSWLSFTLQAFDLHGVSVPPTFLGNPTHAINGSLWSIRYEFLCYLGVAALGLMGWLQRPRFVLAAFLAAFLVYSLQVELGMKIPGHKLSWFYGYPGFWPRLATCFLSGTLFYLYRERIRYTAGGFAAAMAGLLVLGALPALNGLALAVPLLGSYAFFCLGFLPVRRLQGFARRGDLSYGMYLYAFPVQQLVIQWLGPNLHPMGLFPIATVLTTILAVLSWTLVEKPFIKLKGLAWRAPGRAVSAETGA